LSLAKTIRFSVDNINVLSQRQNERLHLFFKVEHLKKKIIMPVHKKTNFFSDFSRLEMMVSIGLSDVYRNFLPQ